MESQQACVICHVTSKFRGRVIFLTTKHHWPLYLLNFSPLCRNQQGGHFEHLIRAYKFKQIDWNTHTYS